MLLVDRAAVQQLVESSDPDAALVYKHGSCLVVSGGSADNPDAGLLVTRRRDITATLSGDAVTDEQLDAVAHRLDNTVRDLGA